MCSRRNYGSPLGKSHHIVINCIHILLTPGRPKLDGVKYTHALGAVLKNYENPVLHEFCNKSALFFNYITLLSFYSVILYLFKF